MDKFDSILKQNKEIKDFKMFDVDAEWNAFQNLVKDSNATSEEITNVVALEPQKKSNRWVIYLMSVAASLLLILASLVLLKAPEKTRDSFATASSLDTLLLVDGSTVYLDKNTNIEFPLTLKNTTERKITLKGNATFEVAKNATLPFKVYYGDIFVEVLGTVFTMSKESGKISIENIEGSVKVAQVLNKDNFKILAKGDVFIYSNGVFTNALDTVVVEPVIVEKPKEVRKKVVEVKEPKIEEKVVVPVEEVKGSKYKLESVIKDHLLKYHKDKIKLQKKSKFDYEKVVRLDINKPYTEILEELKAQGLIDYIKGDCDDCFIIQSPTGNN